MISMLLAILTLTIGDAAEAQASLARAENLIAQNDMAGASLALTEAIAADPEEIDTLQAAALVAMTLGDAERAVEYLEKVMTLDPNNDDARLELARAQWLAGSRERGGESLATLLERHPHNIAALTLDKEMRAGTLSVPTPPAAWSASARAGVAAIYDSNLSLDPGLVPSVSDRKAALMNVELAAQTSYGRGPVPVTLLADMNSELPFDKTAALADLAPTTVGGAVIAQHRLADLAVGFDGRYDELFTAMFSTHLQRSLAPSLFGAYRLAGQELRLLAGLEWRQPEGVLGTRNNLTTKLGLRDTLKRSELTALLDVTARRNRSGAAASSPEAAALRTDFDEIGATAYVEYAFTMPLAAFLTLDGQARKFNAGVKESTYNAMAGGRYELGSVELHAEYAFTKNLSDSQHSYDRHQVTVGVRGYYE